MALPVQSVPGTVAEVDGRPSGHIPGGAGKYMGTHCFGFIGKKKSKHVFWGSAVARPLELVLARIDGACTRLQDVSAAVDIVPIGPVSARQGPSKSGLFY